MTQDEIIEMAREAGIIHPEMVAKHLVAFANLVAAKVTQQEQTYSLDTTPPQQEPVAWEQFYPDIGKPQLTYPPQGIYYTPPQRTWVGLTDEEMTHTNHHMVEGAYQYSFKQGAKWAEAKLKQKNTHD